MNSCSDLRLSLLVSLSSRRQQQQTKKKFRNLMMESTVLLHQVAVVRARTRCCETCDVRFLNAGSCPRRHTRLPTFAPAHLHSRLAPFRIRHRSGPISNVPPSTPSDQFISFLLHIQSTLDMLSHGPSSTLGGDKTRHEDGEQVIPGQSMRQDCREVPSEGLDGTPRNHCALVTLPARLARPAEGAPYVVAPLRRSWCYLSGQGGPTCGTKQCFGNTCQLPTSEPFLTGSFLTWKPFTPPLLILSEMASSLGENSECRSALSTCLGLSASLKPSDMRGTDSFGQQCLT